MRARFKKWNFYSDRVEVRIEGFQIGKLLDAAAKNGILLRSVRVYAETEAQAEIAACDLKRLQKLAGARYRVKPRARRGAVYQTRAFLRRPVLAIGVLLAAAIVIVESFCRGDRGRRLSRNPGIRTACLPCGVRHPRGHLPPGHRLGKGRNGDF